MKCFAASAGSRRRAAASQATEGIVGQALSRAALDGDPCMAYPPAAQIEASRWRAPVSFSDPSSSSRVAARSRSPWLCVA